MAPLETGEKSLRQGQGQTKKLKSPPSANLPIQAKSLKRGQNPDQNPQAELSRGEQPSTVIERSKQYSGSDNTGDSHKSGPLNPSERRLFLQAYLASNVFREYGQTEVERFRETLIMDQNLEGIEDELKCLSSDLQRDMQKGSEKGKQKAGERLNDETSIIAKTGTSLVIRVLIRKKWCVCKFYKWWDPAERKKMYEKEVKMLQLLQDAPHWHVISMLYHSNTLDGESCVLLSPLAQYDLTHYLSQPPTTGTKRLVAQSFGCLASGLAHIHKMNIIHRDIKPGNILIHGGNVIITDMGVSREFIPGSETLSTIAGSEKYQAPEIFLDQPRGQRRDVWSLLCCFMEMLGFLRGMPLPDFRVQLELGNFYLNHSSVVNWLESLILELDGQDERDLARILRDSFQLTENQRPYASKLAEDLRGINCSRPYKYVGECCSPADAQPISNECTSAFDIDHKKLEKGSLAYFITSVGSQVLRENKSRESRPCLAELLKRTNRGELHSIRSAERKILFIIAPNRFKMATDYQSFSNAYIGRLIKECESVDYKRILYDEELGEHERPYSSEYFAILIDEVLNRCRTFQWANLTPSKS